jgi:iron complex transport system ATP-binding protein
MIEIKNLYFSYGKAETLSDISIKLEKGKFYAVVGPNGSGKTTLINILSRLKTPKRGELLLDGKPYKSFKRKSFAKKAALLPQSRNVPNILAYDLVSCGRFPHLGVSRKLSNDDKKIVLSALDTTDTLKFAEKNVKNLSGGERQRVYIAMLLAQNSPYMLLDEPTTHLDISAKLDIMNLLCKIKQNGKCVVAVLHDLDLALKFADEVILMSNGKIVSKKTPKETVEREKLQEVFGVKCESVTVKTATEYVFKHLETSSDIN